MDSELHFGASTRRYIIRERPNSLIPGLGDDKGEDTEGGLLGLPETESELDVSIYEIIVTLVNSTGSHVF